MASDLLTVNVRLFASLREIVGKGQITVEFASKENGETTKAVPATVGDLMKQITEAYPSILSQKIPISIALNGKLATRESILKHRDEVALLPPVSGG